MIADAVDLGKIASAGCRNVRSCRGIRVKLAVGAVGTDDSADSDRMGSLLRVLNERFPLPAAAPSGTVELVIDAQHYHRVIRQGLLKARTSLDLATADLKAMLLPEAGGGGDAKSLLASLRSLARRGVEIRLLHSGTPSQPALRELRKALPKNLTIRRCPRLHAKTIIIDCQAMYLGSANLTGAGFGAKAEGRRNFEWGTWTESSGLIDAVLEEFNALWEGERCKRCRRKDICPVPLEEPAL